MQTLFNILYHSKLTSCLVVPGYFHQSRFIPELKIVTLKADWEIARSKS